MGCDIHAHFEVKINGNWKNYNTLHLYRDYRLFGKIAGVRDISQTPITQPKGFPDDASEIVFLHRKKWGSDGHTDTWLNAAEIQEMIEWYVDLIQPIKDKDIHEYLNLWYQFGYCFGNGWEHFLTYREDYPDFVEDIRFVCWFDN